MCVLQELGSDQRQQVSILALDMAHRLGISAHDAVPLCPQGVKGGLMQLLQACQDLLTSQGMPEGDASVAPLRQQLDQLLLI